jgi:hypothetical protein
VEVDKEIQCMDALNRRDAAATAAGGGAFGGDTRILHLFKSFIETVRACVVIPMWRH